MRILLAALLLQSCASIPDHRVAKVMTPEEKQAAYSEARNSRLFWQCTTAGAGALAGIVSDNPAGIKAAASILIPVAVIPFVSIINYNTYEKDDPEVKAMTDFALAGALGAGLFAAATYVASETGPVAERGQTEITVIPIFALEGAMVLAPFGMLWNYAQGIFGNDPYKHSVEK